MHPHAEPDHGQPYAMQQTALHWLRVPKYVFGPKKRPRKSTDQAPFDGDDIQRDVFTCRARSRAAICNTANYLTLATRSYERKQRFNTPVQTIRCTLVEV